MEKIFLLPDLPFDYNDLEPFMSEETLRIHHDKHHAAYVKEANSILERLDKAREGGLELNLKAELKALAFNAGGAILHSLFWANLAPPGTSKGEPVGSVKMAIEEEVGSFERLKEQLNKTAMSVEGSGWAALVYQKETRRILPMQIEKHDVNLYPAVQILLVLDAFEHAYYLDYKNEKAKFFEAFWNIANWEEVNNRFEKLIQ